jgi:hypothetical protein
MSVISKLDSFVILHQCDLGEAEVFIYDNGILLVRTKKYEQITLDTVKRGNRFVASVGGGRYYNIYQFEAFSDVSPEVRVYGASSQENKHTVADAIVISGVSQKILANFYIKFNKPVSKTKIFNSLDKAVDWLISLM